MSEELQTSKTLSWIFFVISVGSLIAAGIYLEKVIVHGQSLWDILRAIAFGMLGIGVLWAIIFTKKRES